MLKDCSCPTKSHKRIYFKGNILKIFLDYFVKLYFFLKMTKIPGCMAEKK